MSLTQTPPAIPPPDVVVDGREQSPVVACPTREPKRRAAGLLDGEAVAVVLIGAMAMAATFPGRTHGLGMITEPLLRDLGLANDGGRVFYASLNFWGTLIGALFCLPVGWAFDRLGGRWVLAVNLLLLGASVIWMSGAESWQALSLSLVLTRGLGQSALSVVSITIVAKHFSSRRLGMAMAWYAVLAAPFHLALIKGIGWSLDAESSNWRSVWSGVGWGLMLLSVTAVMLRNPSGRAETKQHENQHGLSLSQALRTPAFWTFSLTISIWGMIYAGVALFNEDIFRERGFDRSIYFNVLAVVTVVAIASKFAYGWLLNRYRLTTLLATCLLCTSASLAGLTIATEVWHAYAYAVGLGIASGAVAFLFFATWGRLYGKRHVGRIQGVAQMMTVLASAVGPLLFSVSKQLTNSYLFLFQSLAGIVLLLAFAAWMTPLPTNDLDSQSAKGSTS